MQNATSQWHFAFFLRSLGHYLWVTKSIVTKKQGPLNSDLCFLLNIEY